MPYSAEMLANTSFSCPPSPSTVTRSITYVDQSQFGSETHINPTSATTLSIEHDPFARDPYAHLESFIPVGLAFDIPRTIANDTFEKLAPEPLPWSEYPDQIIIEVTRLTKKQRIQLKVWLRQLRIYIECAMRSFEQRLIYVKLPSQIPIQASYPRRYRH